MKYWNYTWVIRGTPNTIQLEFSAGIGEDRRSGQRAAGLICTHLGPPRSHSSDPDRLHSSAAECASWGLVAGSRPQAISETG
jgi:hypothetical protein